MEEYASASSLCSNVERFALVRYLLSLQDIIDKGYCETALEFLHRKLLGIRSDTVRTFGHLTRSKTRSFGKKGSAAAKPSLPRDEIPTNVVICTFIRLLSVNMPCRAMALRFI